MLLRLRGKSEGPGSFFEGYIRKGRREEEHARGGERGGEGRASEAIGRGRWREKREEGERGMR